MPPLRRWTTITLLFSVLCLAATAQPGRDWGVERQTYRDPLSGSEVVELTSAASAASTLYFHCSNFTADNRMVIFASDRTGSWQLFGADVASGRVRQLTAEAGVAATAAMPDPRDAHLVYYPRGAGLVALDLRTLAGRVVGTVPPPLVGGLQQPTLSHDGKALVFGFQRDAKHWEIGALDLTSGVYRMVIRQGFRIGHVQHHPTLPLIFYVWETGGYAPQRTWLVDADGSANRPFYFRTDPKTWFTPLKEWVTHEAWVSGTGEMTLILDKTGVLIANAAGEARLIAGDYWHAAARPDGRRLVLDDNPGRLWLMETATGNTRLLASGLRDQVRAVHAHASFDRAGRYVLFNTGRRGQQVALVDLAGLPAGDWSRFAE
jgi:oligogalacturonide lyase